MIVIGASLLLLGSPYFRTVLQDVFASLSLALYDSLGAQSAGSAAGWCVAALCVAALVVWAPSGLRGASAPGWALRAAAVASLASGAAAAAGPVAAWLDQHPDAREALERLDTLPQAYLEEPWQRMLDSYTDWQVVTLGTFFIHEAVYFGCHVPWALCDFVPFLQRYPIQPDARYDWAVQWNCLKQLAFNHVFVQVPMVMCAHRGLSYMGFVHDLPLPRLSTVAWQIVAFYVVEDFYFYWIHRFLHWKRIYKYVHKIHHEHAAPFGMTAEYAHPVETVFLGIGTALGPLLFARHLFTLWAWLVVRLYETVEDHSGYDFPWNPTNFIPFWAGAVHHDHHHKTFTGNYASVFTFWDRVFGTDVSFRHAQAEKIANRESSWTDLWYKLGLAESASAGKKKSS